MRGDVRLAGTVADGVWKQVDNRGSGRSVSLCQVGLRWISEALHYAVPLPRFTLSFADLEGA